MNDTTKAASDTTIADLAAEALGNDGQRTSYLGILGEPTERDSGLTIWLFEDGSAIVEGGGGWDVGHRCEVLGENSEKHGWCWSSMPCPLCEARGRVTITVDEENNAEAFWAEVAERRDTPDEIRDLGAVLSVTVDGLRADEIERWVEQIDGWADGPEHAPYALIFQR